MFTKKIYHLFLILFIIVATPANAQFWKKNKAQKKTETVSKADTIPAKGAVRFSEKKELDTKRAYDYEKNFKIVDSLLNVGLPKSANEILKNIKTYARAGNQAGYFIKALRHEVELSNTDDDISPDIKKWQILESELKPGNEVFNMLISLEMASFLKDKFNERRWQGDDKVYNDSSKNPSEWSKEKLHNDVRTLIYQSLDLSKNYKVGAWLYPLMGNEKKQDFQLNLEEIVANRCIDILKNMELSTSISYESPAKHEAMSDKDSFVKLSFKKLEDPKNEFLILSLYQVLVRSGQIYFDLERLKYAKYKYPNSESLFIWQCEKIAEENKKDSFSNLAIIGLAQYYFEDNPLKSLEWIKTGLIRHPEFRMNNTLRNMEVLIRKPDMELQCENINQTGKKILGRISYKNIDQIIVSVYKIDYKSYLNYISQSRIYHENIKDAVHLDSLKKNYPDFIVRLPDFRDFKEHSAEFAINELPEGMHLIIIRNIDNRKDSNAIFIYNNLIVSQYAILQNNRSLQLVSALNGSVMSGKSYKIHKALDYYNDKQLYKIISSGKTDVNGKIIIPDQGTYGYNYIVEVEGNVILKTDISPDYSAKPLKDYSDYQVMTDRAIYRPGQKVFVKVIAYSRLAKKVISGTKITLIMKDNNYEEKGRLELTTNTYGSASGNFELPSGGFNTGNFHILIKDQTYANFQVEEYKRPTFTTKINDPDKAYKLKDDVILKGEVNALSGYAIQGANIDYTVKEQLGPDIGLGGGNFEPEQIIKTGKTVTDNNGIYSIDFKAIPGLSTGDYSPFYIFDVVVKVTDQNGETRHVTYSINMSETDVQLSVMPERKYLSGEAIKIKYKFSNLQDKKLPFSGKIKIWKDKEPGYIQRDILWEEADTLAMSRTDFIKWFPDYAIPGIKKESVLMSSDIISNDTDGIYIAEKKLFREPGNYTLMMQTVDGNGDTIKILSNFEIQDSSPGKFKGMIPLQVNILNGSSFEPGSTVKVFIGSAAIKATVRLIISSHRGLLLDKEIILNQNSRIIEIPVKASDRGNITIDAYMFYNYRYYQVTEYINVPYSNKELQVKLSSFRSDIEPGSLEKWKIVLNGPASEIAAMELLAGAYDASLDELYMGSGWSFFPYNNYYGAKDISSNQGVDFFEKQKWVVTSYWENYNIRFPILNAHGVWGISYDDNPVMTKTWGFESGENTLLGRKMSVDATSQSGNYNKKPNLEMSSDDDRDHVSQMWDFGDGVYDELGGTNEIIKKPLLSPVIRKNFNETAFFFPHLYANKQGEIILEFTVPEALTKWKLMMLAHSKTMQTGYAEAFFNTSKKVMVQPNLPRFLRQGDKITLAAKLVNTTEKTLSAKVNIRITDAETGKELNWLNTSSEKQVVIAAKGNSAFDFDLNIPEYKGIVNIAIFASGEGFSDGEEKTLMVLQNRSLVTESFPITIRKAGKQDVNFASLSANNSITLTHEKLVLEMSSNPAWYAVMALPYLMEFPHECAEQLFSRLYANSIALHISAKNPAIKEIYKAWEREGSKDLGLKSKLMLNQDLKSGLLEESPWLLDAKNENERMKQLAILFNEDKLKKELKNTFEKLKESQMGNGAWPWFKGMEPNSYITKTIVIGFGKMKEMGINISEYENVVLKAMSYLNQEALNEYYKQKNSRDSLKFFSPDLQYLYCKSLFPGKQDDKLNEMISYSIKLAEKNWVSNPLITKAQLLVTLMKLKPESKVPSAIMASFNENYVRTDEMGMYWPENKGGYYWHEAVIETHASIMEAYRLSGQDKKLIDDQQVWLLRQKQTNSWKSTRSTADACYALLMSGNLLNSKQEVKFYVNEKEIVPELKQAGTGYFRQNIPVSEIKSSLDIDINANTSDFAYGAVYWQYFEDMDKIKSSSSGLSIEKKIYKVSNTSTGKQYTEIKVGDKLNIGDILQVSLQVVCDRNLEFVHIKDLRASGTEPANVLSTYMWQNGIGYYMSTKDVSTSFFVDYLSRGAYQLNYILKVEQSGVFTAGFATAQCMYAPEYTATSKSQIITVE